MGIIAFIIIGLIAGLIARAIMPGQQSMGLLATTLLGMAGSLIGGLIGSLFNRGDGRLFDLRPSGIIMSVIGSIVLLLLVGYAGRGRRVHV
ncbi:MAG: GlsB/YeaQ/YmgE family stress response membrane protein [Myxococcaceae bacterium]